MPKVIIDMTMSLDGYVAGPEDGPEFPLGKHDGMAIFDWYFSGTEEYRTPLFKPEPGPNLDQVKRMYEESGAFIFGRRTYDISKGWGGRPSNLTFVTDGIESAIRQAPYLLGGGVRLFDVLANGVRLEKLSVSDGPLATHLRYRVAR